MSAKIPQTDNRILKVLFLSILIDLFGFTSILPIYPSIFAYYETNDDSAIYSKIFSTIKYFRKNIIQAPDTIAGSGQELISLDSVLLGGALGSWFSLLQFFTAPLFTTKFKSSKTAILVSLSGSILASMIWYKSDKFVLFLLARTVGGLFEGNVSIAVTVIGQFESESLRKKGMALVGVAYSLAFVLGPLLGVYLTNFSGSVNFYEFPAIFTMGCAVASFLVIYVFYHPNNEIKAEKQVDQKQTSILFMSYFVYLLTFSGIEFSVGFLLLEKWSKTRMVQGKIYATMGVIMAIMQGGVVRKRASCKLLLVGLVGLGVAFYLLSADSWSLVYIGIILKAVFASCMVPSFNVVAANLGINIGRVRAVGAMARAIGPVLFCGLYWSFGAKICFRIGAVALVLTVGLINKLKLEDGGKKEL